MTILELVPEIISGASIARATWGDTGYHVLQNEDKDLQLCNTGPDFMLSSTLELDFNAMTASDWNIFIHPENIP